MNRMEAEEGGGAGKTYWSLFIFHFSFLISHLFDTRPLCESELCECFESLTGRKWKMRNGK
jgi:hypothetical protein